MAPAPAVEQPEGNAAEAQRVGSGSATGGLPPTLEAAANPDDPASYEAALDRARTAYGWATEVIDENKDRPADPSAPTSPGNILRNTAQWIDQGLATLYLLTPTHDSHHRAGIAKSKVAYFQTGRPFRDGPGSYRAADDGVDDRTGITVIGRRDGGGMEADGTTLTVYGPTSKKELQRTLTHEVQHDADQHVAGDHDHAHFREDEDKTLPDGDVDPFVAGAWVYNKWKSEFRAYWLNNGDEFGSATGKAYPRLVRAVHAGRTAIATTSFANERQSDIFSRMMAHRAKEDRWLTDDYDWATNYAPIVHYYAFDEAFRKAVDGSEAPSGGNLINSVRIQALSTALSTGDRDRVMAAARALDDADRAFLRDRTASAPFWTQVARSIRNFDDIDALAELIDVPSSLRGAEGGGEPDPVEAPADAAAAQTHTVRKGDTLGRIAKQHLGTSSRWPEIYDLNRDQLDSPNHLRRGTVLRLPAP